MADVDETAAEPARRAAPLAAGSQLGRFTLRRVLGEGGMGVVWAAHDPDLDREIAIKLLRHHAAASPALRKRLLREARAMARLKHPNVITVHEVGSAGDTDFIAMELVEGTTMDAWLEHAPPDDDIWRALIAAGRGLAAAHAAGLVHRDFKPHNVLRSRDGRVLVTDFGLARGLGDDGASEPVPPSASVALDETIDAVKSKASPSSAGARSDANASRRSIDSLLDSPLTQTGAMIGTPAYMAPEQFHGAPPDPRTDQFAYCITAWQALTGKRPFTGETLEELRRSAMGGVANVVAAIPKPVRAVLTRGLDLDPAKRWPDLDALIDALDAARRPPKRWWPWLVAIALVIAAIVAIVARRADEDRRMADVCEPADRVFPPAPAFDAFRAPWVSRYQEVCNAAPSPLRDSQLACLRALRDEADAVRLLSTKLERPVSVVEMLPNPVVCTGPSPSTRPVIPSDEPRRGRILELLVRAMQLTRAPADALAIGTDALLADAAKIEWKPLVPMLQVVVANAFLRHDDLARARALMRAALKSAEPRFVAIAHLGLLEAAMTELEDPSGNELEKQLAYTRSAIRAAGGDPILAGSLALLDAHAKTDAARTSRSRNAYDEALELAAEARTAFERAGDPQRAAQAAAWQARIHLLRGHPGALADAEYAARSGEERLAGTASPRALVEVRAQLAFARGEFRDAHAHYDALQPPPKTGPIAGKGRVVDKAGKPVRATVVAWHGELHGDPVRVYTDPRFDGEIIETAVDGTFEFRAGDALIAEAGTRRSAPRAAASEVTLVVEETTATTVGITPGKLVGHVQLFARFRAGEASWFVHTPIEIPRLGGMPRGAHTLGVQALAGDGIRRVDTPRELSDGAAVEIIVRADAVDARAWIFPGKVAPKTRAEVDALAVSGDVASAPLRPIGAGATAAGRDVYRAGDRHAVITGNARGALTACVTLDEAAHCSPITIDDDRGVSPVLFETAPVLHPTP